MAKKETNASIEASARVLEIHADRIRRQIAKDFKNQELETVMIPPLYKPYFGKVLPIMIQGVEVAIPVNGKAYKVPKVFAARARVLMHTQDELIEKSQRAADIQSNFEKSPGELAIF